MASNTLHPGLKGNRKIHFEIGRCSVLIACVITGRSPLAALLSLALAGLLIGVGTDCVRAAVSKPNVVIILADDMGWGDLGCYGHPVFKTPNIDRMASEGSRLTDFYSTCPYCAPSRVALMTGRYQFRSGVTTNPAPDAGINDVGIPAYEITLGMALKSAGYRTCAIGKWHLGHKPEFYPTRHGFDEYLGILYSNDMRPVQILDGEKVVEYPVIQALLLKKYTERALDFITRNKQNPFFLYFPSPMPHKPLAASEDYYKKSGGGLYGDAVAELDWTVGQILGKLKELGLDEKTMVFFTSDNGPYYGGSTGGLRGMKGNTWDGGIREPLIARWPGRIPAGRVSHEPAVMIDLFPTVLTAAGIPIPSDRVIDGRDLMPVLTSDAKTQHEAIFSLQTAKLTTVRSGKWKLHLLAPVKPKTMKPDEKWIDPRAPDGVTIIAPYEQAHPSQYPGVLTGDDTKAGSLYDLENDPSEQHDVAAEHPDEVMRLDGLFREMNKQLPPVPPGNPKKKTAKSTGNGNDE
jgi:uncharacterized sulfatase